ncbi:sugar ABC transporter substrate-binding protein [Fusibacter ferrireducens]|uniref:Sugar ABC transporter substrate-binding protein n=1 Tax=Fusibacter ferrireducens TaxID=2785058 RepID=A0ABR9ZNZ7_9FIRM|nr:sugar ABC transporter substrate-binding protein [Fusibacter ferrireducens]MBF4692159.1 sugar ABC transporter substrate-binding protein [Fusibacter ferrireducens]
MKAKKIRFLSVIMIIFMIGVLSGCSKATDGTATKGNDSTSTNGTTDAPVKVAFIAQNMATEAMAFAAKEFEKYGADYGFEVIILDAKGDAQINVQAVDNAVAQGVKAIFVTPNDINAIIPSLQSAKEAGVIVGMFSSDLPEGNHDARDFFVGVNDNQAGEAAAQAFINHFPDGANIVEIGGQAGHDAQNKRHDGFNNKLEGTNIKVIDYKATQQWATDQAMAIAEDMITKYGSEIDGIFCHWDNGGTGVIQALKAAKMDNVYLVAVDGCRAGFEQVKSGEQSVTIMQNFSNMTKKSLELAKDKLDGKEVESVNFIPLDIVDLDNIDTFTAPEW